MTPEGVIAVRVECYAATLESGRRLFEPGKYDPDEEDSEEAAEEQRRDTERAALAARARRLKGYCRSPKPPGACRNAHCRRIAREPGKMCEVCLERRREYERRK